MTTPAPRAYIPGGFQLTIRLTDGGQPAAVVLGGVGSGGLAPNTSLGATWRDAFCGRFMPLVSGSVQVVGATLRDVSGPAGQVFEIAAPTTNATGGRGPGRPVAAAALLVKWSTETGGRSGKGRTFLPAPQSSDINADGRTYNATFAGLVATAANAYATDQNLAAVNLKPAVLSFTKGAAYPIVSGVCAPVVGIQRRRMRA